MRRTILPRYTPFGRRRVAAATACGLALVACLLVSACASPSEEADRAAAARVPAAWRNAAPQDVDAGARTEARAAAAASAPVDGFAERWWQVYGAPGLDRAVDLALRHGSDTATAAARLDEAAAVARLAGAQRLPHASATLGVEREGRLAGTREASGNAAFATLEITHTLDLWGERRALQAAALARQRASVHDLATVRLTVAAATASAWLETVALGERLTIARANADLARRVLDLVAVRQQAGVVTSLDLATQRALLAERERDAAAMHGAARQAEARLAILLGGNAAEVPPLLANARLDALACPRIDVGLPATLLLRRPDLARAEAALAAADADLRAARAALLPSIDLAASVGGGGNRLRQILSNPLYGLAAALTAPIFDADQRQAERDIAAARRQALLSDYHGAIVNAFGETEGALALRQSLGAQALAQQRVLDEAQRAYKLAEARYRAGSDTLLTLLDAQRTLYEARDRAVLLRLQTLQATVALQAALGGGWQRGAAGAAVAGG